MKLPRQLFIIGGAALVLASIAMAGVSFSVGGTTVALAGDPTTSPDPTVDPCEQSGSINTGGELSIASAGEQCITPTEETLPKTHTPEPEPTDEPRTETPNTRVPATVASTNTPSGGAGAGGLKPPSTGTGGDASGGAMQWLLIAGGMLVAAAGLGSMGYGIRRK